MKRYPALALFIMLLPISTAGAESATPGAGKTFTGDITMESRPGVGFLWTRQSRNAAGMLKSAGDFVDLILSPGNLDVFNQVKPPVRIACIALALKKNDARPFPGIRETIEILRANGIAPERVIIAYNPERSPGTTPAEIDDIVASARQAREMATAYGAPLLIGPGLREMNQREHLYPELARHSDIWLIQSQRLQLDPDQRQPVDPAEYRAGVSRIAGMLKQGNPDIRIIAQIVTTAERGTRVLEAEEVAAFVFAIRDIADAVRIYGASGELLARIITILRPPAPDATEFGAPVKPAF